MRKIIIVVALCATVAASAAAETTTYTYDEQGRLTKAVHTGSVNNGLTSSYGYDKADNRITSSVTGSSH